MKETEEPLAEVQATTATKFALDYTDEERTTLARLYEEMLTPIHEHEVVKGLIVDIHNRDITISIGGKSDGLISRSEFRDTPELKPGDEVEVYVEEQEDAKGQLILSRRKAKLIKAWETIQDAADNDKALDALVKRKTKGGLIVDLVGIEAFLPGSQIDVKPIHDFDAFPGKTIDVAVIKINHANNNVIVSHKALIEKSLDSQTSTLVSNLEKGQILEGTVKNITNFGAFIDLGGVDGLLHITDITWHRINHPEEVVQLGQKVKVVVTDSDEAKERISLGMKQLTPHPWETLSASIQVGSKVKGTIVKVTDYGAFLKILPGVEGLIHISEMTWTKYLRKVQDILQVGDEIEAMVLTIDPAEKKMSLGLKQLTEDPWAQEKLAQKYAVGTQHTGIVKHIAHFGAWIELEKNIDGLLHSSDMSWTRKINHPTDILQLGDQLTLVVLAMDQDHRRLSLGLKQLAENPWDIHEATFQIDAIHPGTIIKKTAQGAWVGLPHGLEGFVPKRHLIKEDGQEAAIHDKLDLQVIEFSSANKKILLAHTPTWQKAKNSANKGQHMHSTDNNVAAEKSTRGPS